MENQTKTETKTFSQFIRLDYDIKSIISNAELDFNKEHSERNKHFLEILKKSSLYASTFEEMNDIDECSYSISYPQNFLTQCDKIVAEILDIKRNKRICCFSNENQNPELFQEDLMWAHYANGCLGAKIIFEVPDGYTTHEVKYVSNIPKVKYDSNNNLLKLIDNNNEEISLNISQNDKEKLIIDTNNPQANIDKFIETIMCYKKECWQYEQEYRAIIEQDRLPIIIKEIILGRKFCKTNAEYEENKKHIDIIVQQIERILRHSFEKNSRKEEYLRNKLSNNIKIKIYKTKYDKTLHTIKTLKF